MDIGSLKKESDLSFDVAIAKRNALEKAHSRLVVVYNEHIFRADAETINLVKTLEEVHSSPFYILDTNNNPMEVSNSKRAFACFGRKKSGGHEFISPNVKNI